jgi:type I restriction enzyme S subunit
VKRGDWSPIRVADLVKAGEAEVKTGPFGTQLHASDYVESGTPVINVRNIGFGGIRPEKLEYIADETVKRLSGHLLQSGDIVFGRKGAVERHVLIKAAQSNWFQGSDCLRLRLKTERVLPQFLSYYLLTHGHQQWMMQQCSHGATMASLNQDIVGRIEFLMPERAIQIRIASILSAYDDLIENNTRRIAILEEMARRLYEEWFVRFRFPGHECVPMVESELGLVPQRWEVKQLQEVATITMGLSPKGDTYNEDAQGTPLINGPVEFGEKFAKRVKWTTAPTKTCKDGDLIVCVRGSTTGKYVKSDGVYCLGRGVCALSSSYQCFVDQLFLNQLPILLNQTGGSTFPSWTGPQLKSHPVLIPPIDLLTHFETNVGAMSAAVLTFSRKNANLRTTRDLLLPKLISGELDVSTLPEPQAETA